MASDRPPVDIEAVRALIAAAKLSDAGRDVADARYALVQMAPSLLAALADEVKRLREAAALPNETCPHSYPEEGRNCLLRTGRITSAVINPGRAAAPATIRGPDIRNAPTFDGPTPTESAGQQADLPCPRCDGEGELEGADGVVFDCPACNDEGDPDEMAEAAAPATSGSVQAAWLALYEAFAAYDNAAMGSEERETNAALTKAREVYDAAVHADERQAVQRERQLRGDAVRAEEMLRDLYAEEWQAVAELREAGEAMADAEAALVECADHAAGCCASWCTDCQAMNATMAALRAAGNDMRAALVKIAGRA